ncbi:unnamed protein product [Leptidea sinapis]|uniref:Protein krueppel n=2 Tax=Leptidea sinapis TaxID=189913 RepID=A0A5E4Q409_9NEOP|nr:unnamed protein product [Leptidea sinapis]
MNILKCKHNGKKLKSSQCQSNSLKEETVASEKQICRVCLKDGEIPIYGNHEYTDISEDLRIFADIEIIKSCNLPTHLCQACYSLLQGAMLLRKTAQKSDNILHGVDVEQSDSDHNMDNDDTFYEFHTKAEEPVAEVREYSCRTCELSFCSFKEYDEHLLSEEHENMRRTCPVCNKSYSAIYFKRHVALHNVEHPYMCDICGKKFNIRGQFTRHRVTHFIELPFKCSLCPYRGRFSESLKMHMRSHTGEKPYQCSQCPSRFVSKSNLNKHALTHKGEHDFKCESCSRGFYTKRELELHYKVDHTGIKEHVCNMCGKAFGHRKQMMKHQLKVHKRQKLRSGRMPLYLQAESKLQQDYYESCIK